MIRWLSIFAFLPFLLLGSVSNQVATIVNTCDNHLQSASTVLQLAKNDCENCLDNLYQFSEINPSAVSSPAASNFYYAVTNCSSAIINIDLALDQINRARGSLNTIPALADGMVTNIIVTVTNVTLVVTTNACEGCSAKLDSILDSLSSALLKVDQLQVDFNVHERNSVSRYNALKQNQIDIYNYEESISHAVNEVKALVLAVQASEIEHYTSITNALGGADQGSGSSPPDGGEGSGSGSCDCATWLQQILQVLNNTYTHVHKVRLILESLEDPLSSYLYFYNDLQDVISEYYNLLNRRYRDFDHRLPDALSAMFSETFSKLNLVTDRFRLDQHNQAASIQTLLDNIGSGDQQFELSNEGLISLYSAATLDRSYLTQVKMYEALTNINFATSNYVDLAWLQDYLLDTQKTFYDSFNLTLPWSQSLGALAPFTSQQYPTITNFFANSPHTRFSQNQRWNQYRIAHSNWFDRVELLLMNLNGLILPEDRTGKLTDSDKDEFERDFEESTNQFSQIDYHLATLSNRLSEVLAKYSECVEAFTAEIKPGSEIEVFEGGTFLGFEIPRMALSLSDSDTLMMIAEPCRSLFSFVWLALLSISSFWLLFRFVKVVTLVFVRGYAFLATFLSPS